MTNEGILQKLEDEIHLRGFSPHILVIRSKSVKQNLKSLNISNDIISD